MNPSTDFIFHRDKKNNVISGGYKKDNIFKKLDIPPITQHGGGNLVIPAGLFFLQQNYPDEEINIETINNKDEISDSLYDKLLDLSKKTPSIRKQQTRKNLKKVKRKTRKLRKSRKK